jgi:signal transduction histidine kinase
VSLRTKLLAVVVGLNGLILVLALLFLVRAESATPSDALVGLLRPRSQQLRQTLPSWDGHVDGAWIVEDLRTRVTVESGRLPQLEPVRYVYEARPWLRAGPGQDPQPLAEGEEVSRVLRAYERSRSPGGKPLEGKLVTSLLEVDPDGSRQLALVAELREPDRGARGVYLVMLAGMVVLSVVGYLLVSRLVVRPLAALTDAAGRMAAGDHRVRLPEATGDDEFGRTMTAFNLMAQEIEEYQLNLEDRVLSGLSQIKRAEQHLAIAQRLAATGKLAAGIAHEINNPIGGMKNAVRALGRGDLPAEKTAEYLALIGDGLARVEETVKKVLAFTPRRVEPRPVDLTDVVRKALALAHHRLEKKGIRVVGKAPQDGDALVFGDPLELQQVALNLLLNSADAIAEDRHGSIEVEVARHGAEEVVLRITDDGCGMSPEDQARCFDLFFTTKEVGEGSGLGLSVVHNIVTNHGGRIELESAPGKGTTFRVFLPREPLAPGAPDRPAEPARAGKPAAHPGGAGPAVTGR